MRQIKFRAWDERSKTMFNVFDMRWSTNGEFLGGGDTWFQEDCVAPAEKWSLKIMQFTGLLDKNGKEIYEGDIIDAPAHCGKAEVLWGYGYSAFVVKDGQTPIILSVIDETDIEIIGNVYEHPELLKI